MVKFTLMKIEQIGLSLQERRKSLNATKSEIAELAGVSVHSLCNLESGKGNPTLKSLLAVADVLGLELRMSVCDVLGGGDVK